MGGNAKPQVTQAPTINPLQEQYLNQNLKALMNMMEGFQFGAPYGGPSASSYSPSTFSSQTTTPPPSNPRDMPGRRMPMGVPGGQNPFANLPVPTTPGGPSPSPQVNTAARALTDPMILSFLQGQTGNFPRRGGSGGVI